MGFDWIKMKSTYEYVDHCICDGYYELDKSEPVIETMPPKYPVKCKICSRKSFSMLKSDVEAVKSEIGTSSKK